MKLWAAVLLAAFVTGLPLAAAHAEGVESPILGELEIKFGEYLPAIDDEFSAPTGPYEEVFGPGGEFYFEVELGFYVWRELGSLAVAVGLGYLSADGKGILADGTLSVDDTDLNVLPLRLSAVWRVDMLVRDYSVPLVPYLKLGLDYYLWWIKSAAGIATFRDPVTDQLDEGRGGTWGWHTALGLQFLLDILAPRMARTLDASTGINHTYLFGEWLYAGVDDFGSGTSLNLGDSAFLFGIAFEF